MVEINGTYWLTGVPETSQLRPRIKKSLRGIDSGAVMRKQRELREAREAKVAS